MSLTSLSDNIPVTLQSQQYNNNNNDSSHNQQHRDLNTILTLERLDPNLYRGFSPPYPRYGRIFGGQTVAQALAAAGKTLDNSKFIVHSLHSYFVRPGNDDIPILYRVERTRDGLTFSTRRVVAIQNGKTIFSMDVSFQLSEPGLQHQYTIDFSKLPKPDDVTDWNIVRAKYYNDKRFTQSFRQFVSTGAIQMSIRKIIPNDLIDFLKPQKPYSLWYVKATHKLPDDILSHQTALSYMSDAAFLETVNLPHGSYWGQATIDNDKKPVMSVASIDHAMYVM